MISLIKWNLWQRRLSTFWWILGVSAFNFINLIFYPSFRDQSEELNKSLEQLPRAAKQLFAGSSDFLSPVGYVNSQIFYFLLPLLISVLAITLGSSLVAKEEREGTIELLLSRPISRAKLIVAKAISGMILIVSITLASFLVIILTAKIVDLEVPIGNMLNTTVAAVALSTCIGSVAFLITMIGKSGKALSVGVSTFIALGGYVVVSLSGTAEWLKIPSKVFPFYYYRSESILRGNFEIKYMIFYIIVITTCSVLSWIFFRRRDLGS